MTEPLIEIRGVRREYLSGDENIAVLNNIDLVIEAGEMVAIVGPSGSGKSTLMNILGCLDRPTSGSYRIAGQETSALDPDALAALRREHFGFIFQRYHLLAELSATANVEVPAVYAGRTKGERHQRAAALLQRLGMEQRLNHRPNQLSGGQQQRVSIARALMNGASVILADEPTGALDRHSGDEVLRILDELHSEGTTVIIVTHDMAVASRADRIIQVSDGEIIADRINDKKHAAAAEKPVSPPPAAANGRIFSDRLGESLRMALLSMNTHRMRTFLTMLGIIIGIASVVCVVALGEGSRQKVLAQISALGTNTLEIFAGTGFGDLRSARVTTLVASDADELKKLPYVAAVTPTVSTSSTVRFGASEASAQVNGVGEQYFTAKGVKLLEGQFFDADSVNDRTQDVVIDENTRKTLFADVVGGVTGRIIFVGTVPSRVVGVVQTQQDGFGSSQNLSLYLPYTTVQTRILGSMSLRSITVRITDSVVPGDAEQAITQFLTQRHGSKDFVILNTDDIRKTITSTTQTLTLLIASIALISLIVGGIGVMNIMLVSVSERVQEIGVRMAVGARQSDILLQFLTEAILVCLVGGILGVLGALSVGVAFWAFGSSVSLIYSGTSIVIAFTCASLVGVVFGYLPARNASLLDPAVALSRD